ncbi:hypothetical protein ACVWYH_002112 [Bradyrhizobium sp. GM24.11]
MNALRSFGTSSSFRSPLRAEVAAGRIAGAPDSERADVPVCARGPLPASRQVYMREQLAKLRGHDLVKAFN